jgi:two-component system CheB/CheR fusion protein
VFGSVDEADRHGPAASEAASAQPPAGNESRRVLVVDDHPDAGHSSAELLALEGHEVRLAHDGPAALDAVRDFNPDAVLLDIGLPGMDGYEVCRRLRQLPDGASTLVIAVTGFGQVEDIERAHDAGIDHHVTKPVDPRLIARYLREAT